MVEDPVSERPEWQSARLAMTLALNTTMRASEIRNLRWVDIDLIERSVIVQTSKTDAGERIIPLNDVAFAAVVELRERSKEMFGDLLESAWYVFPRSAGLSTPDPLRPLGSWRTAWRNLTRSIRCLQCGLSQKPGQQCRNEKCRADTSTIKSATAGFRFHDLRHHAITELGESGASEQTILSIAGHVSRKMLERYSHVRLAAKRSALDGLAGKGHVTKMTQTTQTVLMECPKSLKNLVDETGVEPATSSLRTMRSPN
jgi:integrase